MVIIDRQLVFFFFLTGRDCWHHHHGHWENYSRCFRQRAKRITWVCDCFVVSYSFSSLNLKWVFNHCVQLMKVLGLFPWVLGSISERGGGNGMCPFWQGGTTASQLLKEGCRSHGFGWSVKKKHVRGGEVSA